MALGKLGEFRSMSKLGELGVFMGSLCRVERDVCDDPNLSMETAKTVNTEHGETSEAVVEAEVPTTISYPHSVFGEAALIDELEKGQP